MVGWIVGGWVDEQMDDGFVDRLMDRGNEEGGWRMDEQRCRWRESVAKFVMRVPSLAWLLSLQRPVTLRNAASGPSHTLRRSQVRRSVPVVLGAGTPCSSLHPRPGV